MKTLLICHEDAALDRVGLARWMASFSDLAGILVIQETPRALKRRIKRELKRSGWLRLADVIGYRFYYKLFLARRDAAWGKDRLKALEQRYPAVPSEMKELVVKTPNSKEAEEFVRERAPDLMIARCKFILKKRVFAIPGLGTYVMHPGICPEYRNAHGCFWALAQDDIENVGMTLLRIDEGVDTGPVYGYFSHPYEEVSESHVVIQHRTVLDNLDAIRDKFLQIDLGEATMVDTSGRPSGVWGQPWLTKYLRWKLKARKRHRARDHSAVS